MSKKYESQGDRFDEESLDSIRDNGEDVDEYDPLDFDEPENEESEHDDERREKMKKATSSFNFTGKNKFILLIGLIVVIGALVIFKPLSNGDNNSSEETGESTSFMGKVKSLFGKDEEPEEVQEPLTEENILLQLELDNPGYTGQKTENGSVIMTGDFEGQKHEIIYSPEGAILAEYMDGALIEGEDIKASLNVTEAPAEGEGTGEATNGGTETTPTENPPVKHEDIETAKYEIPEDKVLVNKADFNRSTLSQPIQSISETFDEDGNPLSETWRDKFIVKYEKLPLRGPSPQIFSTVIETGEKIIFPITLEQYVSIADTGTTVLEVQVTSMHGVKAYDSIILDNWKD